MTIEQLQKLRVMPKEDVIRKYLPMLLRGEITKDQYERIEKAKGIQVFNGAETQTNPPQDSVLRPSISRGADDEIHLGRVQTTHPKQTEGLSQKARLLAFLKTGGWKSTVEILKNVYNLQEEKGIARAGARIWDLKQDGHKIESRKKSGSLWEYRLV